MKRTAVISLVILALAGLYGAVRNLPVMTGCDFYAQCQPAAGTAGTAGK